MDSSSINLALDSGGSKVIALLYDRDFHLISTHRTGSLRGNTTPPDIIRQNIDSLIEQMNIRGRTIRHVVGLPDGAFLARLREVCTVENVQISGEFELGMYAAELYGDGLLAIAGTGSTLLGREGEKNVSLGGYGASVSDEGSGYWLGREVFAAAIRDVQQRGAPTLLTSLLIEKIGQPGDDLHTAIFRIYSRSDISPVACVASCAPLVSQAAAENDPVAQRILTEAGRLLGEQLAAMVRMNRLSTTLPVTVSGSVWRSHPALIREFVRVLRENGISQPITVPFFEPIIGGIIRHYRDEHGKFDSAARTHFRRAFSAHTFTVAQQAFDEGLAFSRQ